MREQKNKRSQCLQCNYEGEKMLHCYLAVIGIEHHNACVIGSVLVYFKSSMLFLLEPIF